MEQEPRHPFHILVVDDEPDLEPLIKQRMRPHIRSGKYSFRFAGNGTEALDILSEDDRIDMVVTDINMPMMDGLSLLGQISDYRPDIKSIVVSAYGDMGNIRTAMNRGAFDFVTKPLDFKDFEITIERTQAHITQWKEALQSRDKLVALQNELQVANAMQQAILPREFPTGIDFDVHGSMAPAENVSGDFFDVISLEHGQVGLAVADVSDKGIASALFMMSSRTLLKGAAIGQGNPGEALAEVNSLLYEDNRNVMFVTVVYAVYNPETGSITYANGGHCPPPHRSRRRLVQRVVPDRRRRAGPGRGPGLCGEARNLAAGRDPRHVFGRRIRGDESRGGGVRHGAAEAPLRGRGADQRRGGERHDPESDHRLRWRPRPVRRHYLPGLAPQHDRAARLTRIGYEERHRPWPRVTARIAARR